MCGGCMWTMWCAVLILVIISLTCEASVVRNCRRCYCMDQRMDCHGVNMREVDIVTNIPHLVLIDLSGNKLHALKFSDFNIFSDVTFLNLSDNHLRRLSEDAFRSLSKLSDLDISNNLLHVLPSKILHNNVNLLKLFLSKNTVMNLEFLSEIRRCHIRILNVSHNKIRITRGGQFMNCNRLNLLDLSSNRIDYLPPGAFEGLSDLEILKLQNNKISVISAVVFSYNYNLIVLDLSNNTIDILNPGTFINQTRMTTLDLSHNTLEYIHPKLFMMCEQIHKPGFSQSSLSGIISRDNVSFSDNLHETHNDSVLGTNLCPLARSSISHLNLRHNHLHQMHAGMIYSLREKAFLDLAHNKLKTITAYIVRAIGESKIHVSLHRNLFRCDCGEIYSAYREHVKSHVELSVICESLQSWSVLENMSCNGTTLQESLSPFKSVASSSSSSSSSSSYSPQPTTTKTASPSQLSTSNEELEHMLKHEQILLNICIIILSVLLVCVTLVGCILITKHYDLWTENYLYTLAQDGDP